MDCKSVGKLLNGSYKEDISPEDEYTVVYLGWTKIEICFLGSIAHSSLLPAGNNKKKSVSCNCLLFCGKHKDLFFLSVGLEVPPRKFSIYVF